MLNRGYVTPESTTYPDLELVDSVFDTVSNSITFVLSSEESSVVEVQQFMKNGQTAVLASFPVLTPITANSRLLSFAHFLDSCQLIFVFQNGDIVTATYDPSAPDADTTMVEIVGSIDVGLLAALWSPDEETLSILTLENKIILLSRLFEPLAERELSADDIRITDSKHVSVGWGKKDTQFQGKGFKALEREKEALKHAGLDLKDESSPLRDPTVSQAQKGTLSSFDSLTLKISWRGDGEYFSVTTIEGVVVEDTAEMYDRRVIRVFNREGELDSVNEAVDGLEHNLSWKPQGSLIASTQRHLDEDGDEVLDVVFYERNGLRHGQFNSRLDPGLELVYNIEWSCDSTVLLLQLEDRVQLWTSMNYCWYLKQELFVANSTFAKFHPEKPLQLMIGSVSGIQIVDLAHKIATGPTHIGMDVGMTIVTDGSTMKITPLAVANVPPPISFREWEVLENINDLAVSKSNSKYAALSSLNSVHLCELSIESMKTGKHPHTGGQIDAALVVNGSEVAKQVAFIQDSWVAVVVDGSNYSKVVVFDVSDVSSPSFVESIETPKKVLLAKSQADFDGCAVQTMDGSVYQIMADTFELTPVGKFAQICRDYELATTSIDTGDVMAFGISTNGKLFANEKQIAVGVTSVKTTDSHLMFTTVQSKLCFVHLLSVTEDFDLDVYQNAASSEGAFDERLRDIERGSILVNTMPSKYAVVLEAPRGNLETICPRIMVVSGVRKYIKLCQYKEAFLACRTHRIDLDILHDYDPALFFDNIELFVKQVGRVEHLDLFVSCLHEEDVCITKYRETKEDVSNRMAELKVSNDKFDGSKVNRICEAILKVLSKPEYFETYLQTIITAYACEKPPNLHDALTLIGGFTDNEHVDQAITHLCFLQDVNKLYDTALGLYDVKLTLAIAQKSQKDPKEYLPFLQNLHVQQPLRKKFLIDDFLRLPEKALNWLNDMGPDAYAEFDDYVVRHDLYKIALSLYKDNDQRANIIYGLYAAVLNTQQQFSEAALIYEFLEDFPNALKSYVLGKRWREALTITQRPELKDQLQSTAEQLVFSLTEEHRYSEAAQIEFRFLHNIPEAVKLYAKHYHFEEAILLATKEGQPELIETVVDVQLSEGFGTIAELLADCKGQMNSQLRRLRELREKKKEDPYAFYGVADDMDTPDNVSIAASETSTTPSFFTRYTGKTAGTAKTGASRRTAKNKKREERKKAKGRKGTIYEEEYLIKSVGRLLERLQNTEADGVRLIEGLLRRKMKLQAYEIQKNWVELLAFISEHIVEIHSMSDKDRERIDDNGEVYLIPEIPVPQIHPFPKNNILDY